METSIRNYIRNDKEDCLIAFKSNVPVYFTEEEIRDFENFLDRLENKPDQVNPENAHFFVVVFNDKVIGCGGFGDRFNNNIISLAWGFIHKDFHKKGFGKTLLLYRLEQIKKIYPLAPVIIDTTQYTYSFFEKFGFCTTNITKDYYTVGMHRYDMTLKCLEGEEKSTYA
jgi:predicted GNAT family N-acyltransferase